MAYRKFMADQFFDGNNFQDDNKVLITDEDGTIREITNLANAGDGVETIVGILSPGFINCHCHMELSHMKGIVPKHTGLVGFVQQVMKYRNLPESSVLDGIAKSEKAMYDEGIIAIGDICNTIFTSATKATSSLHYHNFIEATGFIPAMATDRFEQAKKSFNHFNNLFPSTNSIVPHAPYSVSDFLLEKIVEFPGNGLLSMHNQEAAAENEFFQTGTGEFLGLYKSLNFDISFFKAPCKTSLQAVLHKFKKEQQLLLVHNVLTSEEDLRFVKNSSNPNRIYWCLCPNANLYISNRLPDLPLLMKYELPIVLGTDSLASNDQLSILMELQTIRRHFPFIPTEELLRWATLNGAKALQMDNLLGSFEIGKKPGIILIESNLSRSRRLL